jgi:uncharacterized protein CbrC (UPF0167 family)
MSTFAELGIPFPLFEAPVAEASNYAGLSTCALCDGRKRHCFRLGIGGALVVRCPACGTENGLDTYEPENGKCRRCGAGVPFPNIPTESEIHLCYACLRAGQGAITKDTEFGMVSWEQAVQGVTHGVPGLQSSDFELVLLDADEEWYGARVPREHLFELLRTPNFHTWQDERWLFCCRRPMTYAGEWASVMNSARRPADPRAFFESVLDPGEEYREWLWERISTPPGGACLYVFECKVCGRFRSAWDTD